MQKQSVLCAVCVLATYWLGICSLTIYIGST